MAGYRYSNGFAALVYAALGSVVGIAFIWWQ